MKDPDSNPENYPSLTPAEAFHVAADMSDDVEAVHDFAHVLLEIASSASMDPNQGAALYRVACAFLHHYKKISKAQGQLFHGLYKDANPEH